MHALCFDSKQQWVLLLPLITTGVSLTTAQVVYLACPAPGAVSATASCAIVSLGSISAGTARPLPTARVTSVGGRLQDKLDGNKDADPEGADLADVQHALRQPPCALLHALHHCTCACAAVISADDSGRRAPIWCISARKQTRGQTAVRGNYKILQPDLASLCQPLCCRAMQLHMHTLSGHACLALHAFPRE